MKNLPLLMDAVCESFNNTSYKPTDENTFCNLAACAVALKMGCNELSGLMANDMIKFMSASKNWSEIPMDKAQILANQGSLVFATHEGSPHGHICTVMPGNEKFSGRWGKVPTVMNIGKDVFIGKGVNWAFADVPRFYAWRPSL